MKKIPQHINDRLLDYLDGQLNADEKAAIEKIIREDEDVKKQFDELVEADRLLRTTVHLQQPSLQFTQNVLTKLNDQRDRSGISIKNSIYLFVGILIIIGISTVLLSAGVFEGTGNIDLNDVVRSNYIQNLPSIQFSGKLLVNVIIILNIIIAFIVLDRTILKPLFERRANRSYPL